MQNQLLRQVLLKNAHRQQEAALSVEGSASRVISPAGDRDRMVSLTRLNEAICSGSDAEIIAACKLVKNMDNTGPHLDEAGMECLEKLGAWLGTSQNTSQIKSLKALAQINSFDEVNVAIRQFSNVLSQTQMSTEDRIFGAVDRLRKQVRNPDPASPVTEINAAGLQRLDQALMSRDFKRALDAYKAVAGMNDRPEKEIERDVKDLLKLARHLSGVEQNQSPIKSMVENPDIASVKQVIGKYAARTGNTSQEPAKRLVSSVVSAFRHLAGEAASKSPSMPSGTQVSPLIAQGRGAKRRASEEAGETSTQRVRTETHPEPKADAVTSEAALDEELHEELAAILASTDAPPSLFKD